MIIVFLTVDMLSFKFKPFNRAHKTFESSLSPNHNCLLSYHDIFISIIDGVLNLLKTFGFKKKDFTLLGREFGRFPSYVSLSLLFI